MTVGHLLESIKCNLIKDFFGRHGLNIAPVIQHSVGLSQDFSQILKHLKQVEANIQ